MEEWVLFFFKILLFEWLSARLAILLVSSGPMRLEGRIESSDLGEWIPSVGSREGECSREQALGVWELDCRNLD